jgi:hypothetical protein
MRKIITLLAFVLSLSFLCVVKAQTLATVTLAWSPSPSANVAGYKIYYGISSGNYISAVPVFGATTTNVTIKGLISGATYYFAATSCDSSGNQGVFSPEISAVAALTEITMTLTSVLASPAGQFSFAVSGVSGYQCVVQASTDLMNWINLQTNMAPFNFIDSNAAQFSHRFYRTVYIPN